ncbi:bifunctional adenosylcobinamide kinase/adenosylcobinamide-phosphate guanylyltransferase [Alteribacillus sp. JSM 102045]|uniref:bifunctional adenosylcobinamide kinase/adenosylcobinamide-phosphate guanylyltransferase n=1 Tax=Alteribacillus sp. JSM 102045 TaxID=1562101 RepID=UPI0035C16E25
MYFVTGGAFNGKKKWVLKNFSSILQNNSNWHSCYDEKNHPLLRLPQFEENTMVIEGIEQSLKEYLKDVANTDSAEEYFEDYILPLIKWEQQERTRKFIVIGTDVTKGVVPIDKEIRRFRDELGRLYQKLERVADETYIVWFGIGQRLS